MSATPVSRNQGENKAFTKQLHISIISLLELNQMERNNGRRLLMH